MNKNQEMKAQVVAEITEKLNNCQSMVMVKYSGITVEQVTKLRAQCREAGVEYAVLKNTLVRRALNDKGITGLDNLLEGPSAFAFSMKDPVSAAKVLDSFIEKEKCSALEIKGGLLGEEVMDVAKITALAKLPSREVMLGRLLGSMTNSISSFVRVVEAYRKKMAGEE